MCESPIALSENGCKELFDLADSKGLTLFEGIKNAYSMAYWRLILLAKAGKIGDVVSVEATCTSLRDLDLNDKETLKRTWNSVTAWAPNGLRPVVQILGRDYREMRIVTHMLDEESRMDAFTKIEFVYPNAVASVKVGTGAKSEGQLIVSGTKGYIFVPAPWWKTDYFEIRYEDPNENKRYFYQLDGEGIRYEIVAFSKAIETGRNFVYVSRETSEEITKVMEEFHEGNKLIRI